MELELEGGAGVEGAEAGVGARHGALGGGAGCWRACWRALEMTSLNTSLMAEMSGGGSTGFGFRICVQCTVAVSRARPFTCCASSLQQKPPSSAWQVKGAHQPDLSCHEFPIDKGVHVRPPRALLLVLEVHVVDDQCR